MFSIELVRVDLGEVEGGKTDKRMFDFDTVQNGVEGDGFEFDVSCHGGRRRHWDTIDIG